MDSLAAWRVNGLRTPESVRQEVAEIAELGRRFQAARQAKRQVDVRPNVRFLDCPRSPVVTLPAVTISTTEAAKRLGIGERAVQRRAERGSLQATRTPSGELRFDAAEIDKLVKGSAR